MRLDAFLCRAGYSRGEAQRLIKRKEVTVNGSLCNLPSFGISFGDTVAVCGEEVWGEEFIYLALNKPAGFVCTTDPGPDCVLNLIPKKYRVKGLSPVGRLDKETTGLLFLSNDGDFIHRMISPKKHCPKEYIAVLKYRVDEDQIQALTGGILLSDGTRCLPAEVSLLNEKTASVILTEGKYHQVRRMFAAAGNFVVSLQRVRIGNLSLDGLAEGQIRLLSQEQISEV